MKKVKIKKVPKMDKGGNTRMFGQHTPPVDKAANPGTGSWRGGNDAEIKIQRTLQPTSRENATLEAEKGETVVTNLQQEGIPEFYTIGGKPHSRGGTPLNLPENSFIFTKDKAFKIKDPEIQKMFGKAEKKSGYTPAELSKTYDINRYREILANPFTDKIQRETAELMIKNYNLKLGALAIAQESLKGFDTGIPSISIPYMEHVGLNPEDLIVTDVPANGELQQFRDGGAYSSKKRVRIKAIPEYNSGGNFAKQVYQDAGATGQPIVPEATNEGAYDMHYDAIAEKLDDPKIRKGLISEYKKALKNAKPGKHLTQAQIDAAMKLDEDTIVDTFLYKQRQNYAISNSGIDLSEGQGIWDKDRAHSRKVIKDLGFDPLNTTQTAAFQAAYIGLNNLSKNPEYKEEFETFNLAQGGADDDEIAGTGKGTISKVDGWDGNTTSGEIVMLKEKPQPKPQPKEDVEETEVKHLEEYVPREDPKFWTQDINNMGMALADLASVKKYNPWQASPQYTQADPTFQDFRGSVARINAQAQGLSSQCNNLPPAQRAACLASIQRQSVAPILQAQEQEARTNVALANRFEMFNTQSKNQYDQMKAGLDTQLYDKSVIANQAFDNTKRALRNRLKDSFNNAWTNRGKTQTMNELRPDFAVDPTTGILLHDPSNREIVPDNSTPTRFTERVAQIKNDHPDWDDTLVGKAAKADLGIPDQPQQMNPQPYGYPG